jgi:hypothetical protein
MTRINKLNGTIKVGLGQSPSGKVLGDTQYMHLYASHEDAQEQIRKLQTVLQWYRETGKEMFYSHNSRGYQKITGDWISNRIRELQDNI